MMIEEFKQLYELLLQGGIFGDSFHIAIANEREKINIFQTLEIHYDDYGDFLEIRFKQGKYIIAKSKDDFLKLINPTKIEDLQKRYLILHYTDKPLLYVNGITYIGFQIDNDDTFIYKVHSFCKLLQYLINSESNNFVDFVDGIKLGFVENNRKLQIEYPYSCSKINIEDIDIKSIDSFISYAGDKNFSPFLKNAILIVCQSGRISFNYFITKIAEIINQAEINHGIYINSLSIDKIRKDYEEYRNKYFIELIQIESALTKSIIAVPVAVAAYIFTIFQQSIQKEIFLMIFIIILVLVTAIGLIFILRLYRLDIGKIKKICDDDFKALRDNQFFVEYPDQLKLLEATNSLIIERINYLNSFLYIIFLFIALSHFALLWYMLGIIGIHLIAKIITLLIILSLLFFIFLFRKRNRF